jgi:hypothetical protein
MPELDAKSTTVERLLSEADLSPIPSPDYDAPSPEPNDQETELRLPDEDPMHPQQPPQQPQNRPLTSQRITSKVF